MNLKVCTWLWCCLKIMAIVFQHWKIFQAINLLVIHVACSFLWLWRVYFYAIFGEYFLLFFFFVIYSVLIVVLMSNCWIYLQLLLIFFFGIEAFHIPFSINFKSYKLCLTVQFSFGFFFWHIYIYIYIYIYSVCVWCVFCCFFVL